VFVLGKLFLEVLIPEPIRVEQFTVSHLFGNVRLRLASEFCQPGPHVINLYLSEAYPRMKHLNGASLSNATALLASSRPG